ncbi:unnamed protein product [Mytilus edulis]|uniref:Uncharacterized protein n=1 Tax=Mytilus edulis TaxID=6550 RepID=A0A8S3UK95_MYTED|nr:unnamed protein product [Mytilus edulis]
MPNKRNAIGSPSRAMGKKRRTTSRTEGKRVQHEEIAPKKDRAGRRRTAKKTKEVGHVVAEVPVETADISSGEYYLNKKLYGGLNKLCPVEKFAKALHWIIQLKSRNDDILHYLNDFLLVESSKSWQYFELFQEVCNNIGIPLASDKDYITYVFWV